MTTYVNSKVFKSLDEFKEDFKWMELAGHEYIHFEFPDNSPFTWIDNSVACQDWLKRIGREDLVRKLK